MSVDMNVNLNYQTGYLPPALAFNPYGQMFQPNFGQTPFRSFMQNFASGLTQTAMSAFIPSQIQAAGQLLMGAGQLMQQLGQRLQYGQMPTSPYNMYNMGNLGMRPGIQSILQNISQLLNGPSPFPYSYQNQAFQNPVYGNPAFQNSVYGNPAFLNPSCGTPQYGVPTMGVGPQVDMSINANISTNGMPPGTMPYSTMPGTMPYGTMPYGTMPYGTMPGTCGTDTTQYGVMPLPNTQPHVKMPGMPTQADQVMRIIDQNFGTLAHGKETFNKSDLESAAKDKSNPQLAAAARWLLDNPMAFDGLDTAVQHARGNWFIKQDGKVGHDDMRTSLSKTKNSMTDDATISVLQKYSKDLFGKAQYHHLRTREDFQKIATTGKMPNGKSAPPDLVAACKNLVADKALWDKIDSAQTHKSNWKKSGDNKISLRDLQTVATKTDNNFVPPALQTPGGNYQYQQYQPSPYQYPGAGFNNIAFSAMQNNLSVTGSDPTLLMLMNQNSSLFLQPQPFVQPQPMYAY